MMWKWVLSDLVVAISGTALYGLCKLTYPRVAQLSAVIGGMAWLALPVLVIVALFV